MVNDPIADFITQIRNAGKVGKESVAVPFSQVKMNIAKALEREGYIGSVAKRGRKTKKFIEVGLMYKEGGVPKIKGSRRISKLSRRIYTGAKDTKRVKQGLGMAILSTPQGILTDAEARKKNVGGEILLEIWQ